MNDDIVLRPKKSDREERERFESVTQQTKEKR